VAAHNTEFTQTHSVPKLGGKRTFPRNNKKRGTLKSSVDFDLWDWNLSFGVILVLASFFFEIFQVKFWV